MEHLKNLMQVDLKSIPRTISAFGNDLNNDDVACVSGENPAAMQHGGCGSLRATSLVLIVVTMLFPPLFR
ncbi:hypothetical protein K0M31_002378 [Melipona bicolor]|uniref:Uncharacterized protein n=1 Tax=Melipona bicolor TaxID=60889 RepID=A0AA40KYH2_9HYME|nr:hypothetical protein K0M31_002378 [Melipona bicolor]